MNIRILAPAMALWVAGCVSIGTNYDPTQLPNLTPGMTEAQVIDHLGKPNARSFRQDGTQIDVWSYSQGTAVGTGHARTAALLFDQQKRFVRVLSESESRLR
jgi:outer membrane protein assembly factor BamE (lipoprotein component of BamABCDE complex)